MSDNQMPDDRTLGQRVADGVAKVGGSWPFVIGFILFMVFWIAINALNHFDGGLLKLNLILSALAGLQAPIIMMSQNRQADKDREQALLHYQLAQKAEREAREVLSLLNQAIEDIKAILREKG